MERIIECVPNFSEGRRPEVIDSIAGSIGAVAGVKVLNIDPGKATNRTVITFAGNPEAIVEAAFQGVKRASKLIDMRLHQGEHPRIGATDVLPLVPVCGITLEECAILARKLSQRIFEELGIPVYCYEAAAFRPAFRNLAVCRRGEYESLSRRILDPEEMPDFGGGAYTEQAARSGASVVGARDFLLAVNFNLDITDVTKAKDIALDVREKGRPKRENGRIIHDENGNPVMISGKLKGCKAIGWYIEEYGIAQVSMNITDIHATPLHVAFEEVSRAASLRGLRVTGTEIIGLVPRTCLIEAGKYFLTKQSQPLPEYDDDIINKAVNSLGLDDISPFDPSRRIIENLIAQI